MMLLFVTLAMAAACCSTRAAETEVSVDARDHLRLHSGSTGPVLLQGIDILAAMGAASADLRVLSSTLGLEPVPTPPAEDPVSALCFCTRNDCSPAVRLATGVVTCCAAAAPNADQCQWTGLGGNPTAAAAACTAQMSRTSEDDRQVMRQLRLGAFVRVPFSTEGLALLRSSLPICASENGAGAGATGAASPPVLPAAAAAAGGLLFGAVIGVVCWVRRGRRNVIKAKLMAPSGAFLASNPTSIFTTEPDYEDPDLFEMTPREPVRTDTSTGSEHAVLNEAAYSELDDQRTRYTDPYNRLADGHRTYTQTSNMLLPGQIFAAAAAAAGYEEPLRSRPTSQRSPVPSVLFPASHKTVYHMADSQSDDYVDVNSDEQTA